MIQWAPYPGWKRCGVGEEGTQPGLSSPRLLPDSLLAGPAHCASEMQRNLTSLPHPGSATHSLHGPLELPPGWPPCSHPPLLILYFSCKDAWPIENANQIMPSSGSDDFLDPRNQIQTFGTAFRPPNFYLKFLCPLPPVLCPQP